MKTKLISGVRSEFEEKINEALTELNEKEIIDIKFTAAQGNNNAVILNALILYKD